MNDKTRTAFQLILRELFSAEVTHLAAKFHHTPGPFQTSGFVTFCRNPTIFKQELISRLSKFGGYASKVLLGLEEGKNLQKMGDALMFFARKTIPKSVASSGCVVWYPIIHTWGEMLSSDDSDLRSLADGLCSQGLQFAPQQFIVRLRGIEGTPFRDFYFYFDVRIPIDYPFKPPAVHLLQPVFHWRVPSPNGTSEKNLTTHVNICTTEGYEVRFPRWRLPLNRRGTILSEFFHPLLGLVNIFFVLRHRLFGPLDERVQRQSVSWFEPSELASDNPSAYDRKASELCRQYAEPVSECLDPQDEWTRICYAIDRCASFVEIRSHKNLFSVWRSVVLCDE